MVKLTGHSRNDIKPGEYAVVFRHVVVTGKASLNKTDLIIVTAAEYTRLMAEDTTGRTMLDISTEFGRIVLAGLSNTDLAKVIGKGKWQDLFSPDAARVDFSPTQSADPEVVGMIGKTLEGLVPVRNGEDVDMIDGIWSVIALTDDGDKLILEEKAEPKRRSMGVPRTWAKARIEAYGSRGQGKEVTTATVDAADFKVMAALLAQVHGSHVSRVDARLVQGVHMRAGAQRAVPVQPDGAPPDVLRRDALSAIIDLESRLAAAGWDVGKALHVTTEFMLDQLLKVLYAAGPRRGDRVANPIDTTKPTGSGGGPIVISKTPRFDAVRNIAVNAEEFDKFQKQAGVWIERDAERRAIILSHEATAAGYFETWLRAMGPTADPAIISGCAGSTGLDAGALLLMFLPLHEAAQKAEAKQSEGASMSSLPRNGFHVTVRTDHGGDSVSELEKRERSGVQADFVAIEKDDAQVAKLTHWGELARAGSVKDIETMRDEVSREPEGALSRLLHGSDIHSVTVDVEPSIVESVNSVRAVLERAIEKAVLGHSHASESDRVIRQLKFVRTGKLGKVKLLLLIDKDDSATEEDPLKSFAGYEPLSAVHLTNALNRMQTAWVFACPQHGGEILQFISALSEKLTQLHADGVKWPELSKFYQKVMRKAAADVGPNGRSGSVTGKPDRRWANDPSYEWVVAADRAATVALATKLASEASAAATAAANSASASKRSAQSGVSSPADKAPSKKAKAATPKQKSAHKNAKAVKSEPPSAPAVKAEPKESFYEIKARVTTELTDSLGLKDGKPPCFFHHHQGKCRFPADKCNVGWH